MLRLVDIFAGCGGLSLGFDLCKSQPGFRTALAIDNEPSAIRLFNDNFSRLHARSHAPIGRVADVCWFETAQEIRLYYLAHLAKVEGDEGLRIKLASMGFGSLLASVRELDRSARVELAALASTMPYRSALADIPKAAFSLATVRKLLRDLGVRSMAKGDLDDPALPWSEEYLDPTWRHHDALTTVGTEPEEPSSYGEQLWDNATLNIRQGAGKQGRGQNVANGQRYAALGVFLDTAAGELFKTIIIGWRGERRRLIDAFLRQAGPEIDRTYFNSYRAEGLLGGPPCKGFSRIGRPVANALREQGAFAWSNGEFGDERNKLVLHYVMFLEALQPRFFVFENVSNFQSALKTPDGVLQADELLQEAIENLSAGKLHYDVASAQLKATRFGVPQSRIRFIMFGINLDFAQVPAARFFDLPVAAREVSTAESFYGLPAPHEFSMGGTVSSANELDCAIITPPRSDTSLRRYFEWVQQPIGEKRGTDAHVYRRMRKDDEAFFAFMGPGIRWMDLEIRRSPTLAQLKAVVADHPELRDKIDGSLALRLLLEETVARSGLTEQHLLSSSYLGNGSGSHGDWMERLDGDSPSKTVVAHIGKDTYGYIHPYSTRPITLREAARLQSFPDSFSFAEAGMVDGYTAVGNAVAPLLANIFAERIAELLFGNSVAGDDRKVVSFTAAQRRLL